MAREMGSLDEFLTHKGTERSGGSFLKNWKDEGKLNVFLHPKVFPTALWQHGVPKIFVKDDDHGDPKKRVWTGKYPCAEDEKVLKKQFKRDGDGEREVPPRVCGICKLIEHTWQMVEEGKIDITTPLFKFEADDDDETVVLHAGGICGRFPKSMKEASEEEAKAIKKAGIQLSESWKEAMHAKLNYVFYIVNADAPEDGCQIAVETGLLGDKVKDVIADAIESLGKEEGNPFIHPYCIQWEYREKEKVFSEKYKARRIERIELTPEIERLLKSPRPDLAGILAPPDPKTMRSILERACLKRDLFPWDEFFKPLPEDKQEREEASGASAETDEEDDGNPDGDMVACDACEKPMKESDHTCPHCGKVYDEEAAARAKQPAPPPATRKRSAAKKGTAGKGGGDQGDNVPF